MTACQACSVYNNFACYVSVLWDTWESNFINWKNIFLFCEYMFSTQYLQYECHPRFLLLLFTVKGSVSAFSGASWFWWEFLQSRQQCPHIAARWRYRLMEVSREQIFSFISTDWFFGPQIILCSLLILTLRFNSKGNGFNLLGFHDCVSVLKDAKERHAIEEVVDSIEKGNNIEQMHLFCFLKLIYNVSCVIFYSSKYINAYIK